MPVKVRVAGEVQETTIRTIINKTTFQPSFLLSPHSLCNQTSIAIMPSCRNHHSNASRILNCIGNALIRTASIPSGEAFRRQGSFHKVLRSRPLGHLLSLEETILEEIIPEEIIRAMVVHRLRRRLTTVSKEIQADNLARHHRQGLEQEEVGFPAIQVHSSFNSPGLRLSVGFLRLPGLQEVLEE